MDKNNHRKWEENSRKFNYLHFLYNATHPQPHCSSPPHQVYIELTNSCNLKCTHCPQYTMRRKKQFMSIELFEKIIAELRESQPFIDLYLQGEPLLHPKIVEIVKIVKANGLLPRITTNTTLLKPAKAKALIEAGLDKIEFSMSGASKKTYDSIYKGAKFEKTLNNMLDFLEMNGEAGFPVHTRSVFVEEEKTIKEKDKYLECFALLPLDDVYISPLINMFGWNEELDISSYKKTPMKEWPICKSPWRQLGINADGTTRACVFDYDSRYIIGNAQDDDALDLWNNERMAEFRKALIERRYEDVEEEGLPLCTVCSQLWPTSPLADTTQLPDNFQKEVDAFFKSEQYGFMATKYLNIDVKKEKLQYLKQHREEWLRMIMADVV